MKTKTINTAKYEYKNKGLIEYIPFAYLIKFTVLMVGLYNFHLFYYGITTPGGSFYSGFLEQNLNYIEWVRYSLLYPASLLVNAFNYEALVDAPYSLQLDSGTTVTVGYYCLGLAMMSFWLAFVMAQDDQWWRKLRWTLLGVLAIWFLNCWRIALVLISLDQEWGSGINIDQHDLFNLVGYTLILMLIYSYYRSGKKWNSKHIEIASL